MFYKGFGFILVLAIAVSAQQPTVEQSDLVVPVKEVALNDSTTSQAPLLRNRFKVRRTQVPNQVPNKNREEHIKHREALPSKTRPEFIKPQHVKTMPKAKEDPIINEPTNEVSKTDSKEEPIIDVIEKRSDVVDVLQKRIDIVDSSEEVTTQEQPEMVQAPVRLRVVEMEMFKCHRGCMAQKTLENTTDEVLSTQVCDLGELGDSDAAMSPLKYYNSCICKCKMAINQKRQLCLQGKGKNCPKAIIHQDGARSRIRAQRKMHHFAAKKTI